MSSITQDPTSADSTSTPFPTPVIPNVDLNPTSSPAPKQVDPRAIFIPIVLIVIFLKLGFLLWWVRRKRIRMERKTEEGRAGGKCEHYERADGNVMVVPQEQMGKYERSGGGTERDKVMGDGGKEVNGGVVVPPVHAVREFYSGSGEADEIRATPRTYGGMGLKG